MILCPLLPLPRRSKNEPCVWVPKLGSGSRFSWLGKKCRVQIQKPNLDFDFGFALWSLAPSFFNSQVGGPTPKTSHLSPVKNIFSAKVCSNHWCARTERSAHLSRRAFWYHGDRIHRHRFCDASDARMHESARSCIRHGVWILCVCLLLPPCLGAGLAARTVHVRLRVRVCSCPRYICCWTWREGLIKKWGAG